MNAKCEILIISYLKDKPYLHYCLRSIQKFATGFSGTTLVVPSVEASEFASMAAGFGMGLRTYERDPNPVKWHLHAQVQKHRADEHCPDADFILHTDSDCVFTEPVTPDDYFVDGKPVMLFESYTRIPGKPVAQRDRAGAQAAGRVRVHAAAPAGQPHWHLPPAARVHRADSWGAVRAACAGTEGQLSVGWTEHNVIGAFAYYSSEWKPEVLLVGGRQAAGAARKDHPVSWSRPNRQGATASSQSRANRHASPRVSTTWPMIPELLLGDCLTKYDIRRDGILHVGAGMLEEADDYDALKFTTVVWVEALPDTDGARQAIAEKHKHTFVNVALGREFGQDVTFHVNASINSSSFLALGRTPSSTPNSPRFRPHCSIE